MATPVTSERGSTSSGSESKNLQGSMLLPAATNQSAGKVRA
jgi:hypothetical protein